MGKNLRITVASALVLAAVALASIVHKPADDTVAGGGGGGSTGNSVTVDPVAGGSDNGGSGNRPTIDIN